MDEYNNKISNDIDPKTDADEEKNNEYSEEDQRKRAIVIRVCLLMILAIVSFSYMTILGIIDVGPYAEWLREILGTSIG